MEPAGQIEALRALYREIDSAIALFVASHPRAGCPVACHACCCVEAPLVSSVEDALIEQALDELAPALRAAIGERAARLRAALEAGAADSFECPLLVDGRCAVYASRPYLCRSFGHSARRDDAGELRPYTCRVLRPQLGERGLPELPFRIGLLRERVTGGRIVDSLLPIWLSTRPEERSVRWLDDQSGIAVADAGHRLAGDDDAPARS